MGLWILSGGNRELSRSYLGCTASSYEQHVVSLPAREGGAQRTWFLKPTGRPETYTLFPPAGLGILHGDQGNNPVGVIGVRTGENMPKLLRQDQRLRKALHMRRTLFNSRATNISIANMKAIRLH
jgi:hypothetical protein